MKKVLLTAVSVVALLAQDVRSTCCGGGGGGSFLSSTMAPVPMNKVAIPFEWRAPNGSGSGEISVVTWAVHSGSTQLASGSGGDIGYGTVLLDPSISRVTFTFTSSYEFSGGHPTTTVFIPGYGCQGSNTSGEVTIDVPITYLPPGSSSIVTPPPGEPPPSEELTGGTRIPGGPLSSDCSGVVSQVTVQPGSPGSGGSTSVVVTPPGKKKKDDCKDADPANGTTGGQQKKTSSTSTHPDPGNVTKGGISVSAAPGTSVFNDGNGHFQQAVGPATVMDAQNQTGGYDLSVYPRSADLGTPAQDGSYPSIPGTTVPMVRYEMRSVSSSEMTVTEKRPSLPDRVSTITKIADGHWKLAEGPSGGNAVRVETVQRTASSGGQHSLIREVKNGDGGGAVTVNRIQQDIDDATGHVVKEWHGPSSLNQRTVDHFYNGSAYEGFGDSDGPWSILSHSGNIETEYRPLHLSMVSRTSALANLAANSIKIQRERTLAGISTSEQRPNGSGGHTEIASSVQAINCRHTDLGADGWLSHQSINRGATGGGTRSSSIWTHGPGAPAHLAGRLAGRIGEDGIAHAYRYEKGTLDSQGAFSPNANGDILKRSHLERVDTNSSTNPVNWTPIANKTAISTAFENAMGCVAREEDSIATGASTSDVVATKTYARDDEGKVTEAKRDGRTVYGANWQGPRRISYTNEEGEQITLSQFDYDHRPTRSVSAGFAGDGAEAPARAGTQIDVTYDALGRVVTETQRDAGAQNAATSISRVYDGRGRVTSETTDGVTVTVGYEISGIGGGPKITMTYPGNIQKVTEYARDGQVVVESGNGQIGRTFAPIAASTIYAQLLVGQTESVAGLTYHKTYRNGFGELIYETRPNGTAGQGEIGTLYTYDSLGRPTAEHLNSTQVKGYVYEQDGDYIWTHHYINSTGTPTGFQPRTYVYTYKGKVGQAWYLYRETATGTSRIKLSGFGPNGAGPEWIVGEEMETEVSTGTASYTRTRTMTHYENRGVGLRRMTVTKSGATNMSESKTRHGYFESALSFDGGARTVYGYDGVGRTKTVLDGVTGATIAMKYEDSSFPFQPTEIKGTAVGQGGASTISTRAYVAANLANAGKLSSEIRDGQTNNYTYTLRGELETESGARNPVRYEYNGFGQMTKMHTFRAAPNSGWTNGDTTTWGYNNGMLVGKTDAANNTVNYEYNQNGWLSKRTWARGVYSTYLHDRQGRVTKVTHSDGTPGFEWTDPDGQGFYTKVVDGHGTHTVGYGSRGDVTSHATSDGGAARETQNQIYDALGRLSSIYTMANTAWITNAPSGYLNTQSYSYHSSNGELYEAGAPSYYFARYIYNPATPLVEQKDMLKSGKRSESIRTYDGLGRLASTTEWFFPTPNGGTVFDGHTYTYHATRPFERTRDTRKPTQDSSYWDYTYNARNEVTGASRKLSNGTALNGWQFGYNFDLIGNRTGGGEGAGATQNGRDSNYTISNAVNQYDSRTVPGAVDVVGDIDQPATTKMLVGRVQPTPAEAAYSQTTDATQQGAYFHRAVPVDNSAGPVLAEMKTSGVRLGTTDIVREVTGRALLPPAAESFTYDFDGNLTGDGLWTYTWDANNRLVAMETKSSVPVTVKRKLAFTYDWMGRRVKKKVWTWDPALNGGSGDWVLIRYLRFCYHGWNLVVEMAMSTGGGAETGTALRRYQWGRDLSGTLQGAGGVGGLIGVEQVTPGFSFGTVYFPVYDGNGNVMSYVNGDTGAKKAEFAYGAFGEPIRATGEPLGSVGSPAEFPIRWSTKYTDEETGLVSYELRYYQPATGRWLNRDYIENADEPHALAFVQNNPMRNIDVWGLWSKTLSIDLVDITLKDEKVGKLSFTIKAKCSSEGKIKLTMETPKITDKAEGYDISADWEDPAEYNDGECAKVKFKATGTTKEWSPMAAAAGGVGGGLTVVATSIKKTKGGIVLNPEFWPALAIATTGGVIVGSAIARGDSVAELDKTFDLCCECPNGKWKIKNMGGTKGYNLKSNGDVKWIKPQP